ncbi:uncharacterized protein PgNI_01962 [Pyricularia grisea]|uniref:Imidazoleglycerol-phosphate dehydratase n=1 Tax=Pyricularia grisea TaxID=148305 RepID=A0A6P8BH91_PYRGI|nr:uncharacterized protein PgNI_01962 [Pyricularia grisea]TLD16251.1 hypothetical protein PgNI_01962 [Pyricularia grisea]
MSRYDVLRREEAVGAGRAAAQAGVVGAARWGVGFAILGGIGYAISPIYRGLTIQFKTYIQMSGMVFGGMIEADRGLRSFEAEQRSRRRAARNQVAWEAYEKELRALEGEEDMNFPDQRQGTKGSETLSKPGDASDSK